MNNNGASAVSGGTGAMSTPANNVSGNRRGSAASQNSLFSGLMNQKRNSTDEAANARRMSFNEQKPAPGFIGKMWNNFVTGQPNVK
ncbi:hypothetical protein HYFRA_00000180 [Hymenoscyphus fraxineus]|uniref:Conidiation-specific protein 8 n=1 Tax=Hymenoscyphus fraxineus TaxID=746836 RepID=A0A9N9L509_9HELO|nr:hypothetical protein HYFRA_00000180 [Hymenoscyphus fraxineus]